MNTSVEGNRGKVKGVSFIGGEYKGIVLIVKI